MFKVDDHIIYGTTGVCKITDIVTEKNRDGNMVEYYVLNVLFEKNTTVKIPTNNDKIFLRALTSVEEAKSIINTDEFSSLWIENEKERNAQFKILLRQGDLQTWVNLAKSIHVKKLEKIEASKKLSQSDEGVLKSAESLLREELSVILNTTPSEIEIY